MLIDLFSSELITGYKEIKTARQALLNKWRLELLRAYTNQRNAYTQQLERQDARRAQYQRALPFLGVLLLVICGIGTWLTFRSVDMACLGMLLMLGTGFGALLATVPLMGLSRPLTPPENPVSRTSNDEDESALRQRLFPELLPRWRREMVVPVPLIKEVDRLADQSGDWSLIGEFDLIRELERVVSSDTYILHRVQLGPVDYMDVVVIGPKGFWFLQVKHWNAHFIWQEGIWQIWQFDFEAQAPRPVPMDEYPDAEWARLREEALTHLKSSSSDLLKTVPVLGNIQGGIVFSHPNATIEIDRSAPFRYGTLEQWVAVYQAAPRLKDMSAGRALHLVEMLLNRHQSFFPQAELHSMKDAVGKVVAEVERGIEAWIEGVAPSVPGGTSPPNTPE